MDEFDQYVDMWSAGELEDDEFAERVADLIMHDQEARKKFGIEPPPRPPWVAVLTAKLAEHDRRWQKEHQGLLIPFHWGWGGNVPTYWHAVPSVIVMCVFLVVTILAFPGLQEVGATRTLVFLLGMAAVAGISAVYSIVKTATYYQAVARNAKRRQALICDWCDEQLPDPYADEASEPAQAGRTPEHAMQSRRDADRFASEGLPGWAWIFMIACGAIPVISLGGAIPMAIGFASVAGCRQIAIDSKQPLATRVAVCLGITILAWAAFIGVVIGFVMLNDA